MTELAAEHGMDVHEIRGAPFDEREVVLSPKSGYTEEAERAVKEAFSENARKTDQNVKITVIPF